MVMTKVVICWRPVSWLYDLNIYVLIVRYRKINSESGVQSTITIH